MFIGGIGPEIVESDLKAYFDNMGEITDIVVMKGMLVCDVVDLIIVLEAHKIYLGSHVLLL